MSMQTIKINNRLSIEERETHLWFDSINNVWTIESFIPKHFKKAIKQGWTTIKQYIYDDGSVCGMELTAPARAITIRNAEKKKLSEKQMNNLNNNE